MPLGSVPVGFWDTGLPVTVEEARRRFTRTLAENLQVDEDNPAFKRAVDIAWEQELEPAFKQADANPLAHYDPKTRVAYYETAVISPPVTEAFKIGSTAYCMKREL